jgi:hypothetical protein
VDPRKLPPFHRTERRFPPKKPTDDSRLRSKSPEKKDKEMSASTPAPAGLTEEDVARIVAAALKEHKASEENEDRHFRDEKDGKRYWKTSDVGYFWPDMPLHYGIGRVVDYDGSRYFRDVNSFVSQIEDSVVYYTAEVVRNNLQNCLKGQAFSWYSDIVPAATKKALRNDTSAECTFWTDTLVENFKRSGAQAMDRISSEQTRYTMQMLKSGVSLVSWFTDMISLATDAEFAKEDQKLRFVWHKMDAELRDRAPELLPTHTVQTYLNALRKSEESIREAVRAQDRRIAMQFRPTEWRNSTTGRTANYNANNYQQRQYRPYIPADETTSTTVTVAAKKELNANRNFSQYIPEAFKKPESSTPAEPARFTSDEKGKGKEVVYSKPNWANGPLAARRDTFRVNPKRNCRYCNGYHYDSMCRNRTARTPRVYYNEMGDIYTVDSTEDDDYDQDHQEFVSTFFATGNSIDDYYRLCDNWQDYRSHDIVECGLAEADLDHTITNRTSSLKSGPTTAVLQKHAARTGYTANTFLSRVCPDMLERTRPRDK